MRKKLRSRAGETLIEVLISILVVILSVTLLYSMLMAASGMNERAKALGAQTESEQNAAEARTNGTAGTVTVTYESKTSTVSVNYYSLTNAGGELTAYTAAGN
jgi:type II secretory pathway pseudopilin PulG